MDTQSLFWEAGSTVQDMTGTSLPPCEPMRTAKNRDFEASGREKKSPVSHPFLRGQLASRLTRSVPLLMLLVLPYVVHPDGFLYTKDHGAVTITGYSGSGGAMIVPGTIEGLPVTRIGSYAFSGETPVTSVTISEGVLVVELSAFFSNQNLTNVVIPSSARIISGAFSYCYSLSAFTVDERNPHHSTLDGVLYDRNRTALIEYPAGKRGGYVIPDTVTRLAGFDGGLNHCPGLTSVVIPSGFRKIGREQFRGCSALTNVLILGSITNIGQGAFEDCYSLEDIAIQQGVTRIEETTFKGCRSLARIVLLDGLVSIGPGAFWGCASLTEVSIPETVSSIACDAFAHCSRLGAIYVDPNNPWYADSEGVLLDKSRTELLQFPGGREKRFTIHESISRIGPAAFMGCAGLTGISIPDTVTNIAGAAFSGCSGLTEVTIPQSVSKVEPHTFSDCTSLTNVLIPEGVTGIDWAAFSGCSELERIVIPESASYLGGAAFLGCRSLVQVNLPRRATTIGWQLFGHCTSLRSIEIPDAVTDIEPFAFTHCSSLTSINLPSGLTNIQAEAFRCCSSLASLAIPSGVSRIGDGALAGCSALKEIKVDPGNSRFRSEDGVLFQTSWWEAVLSQYPAGREGAYSVPEAVGSGAYPITSIGTRAFEGCVNLTSVTISHSVREIQSLAFTGCAGLTSLAIPGNVYQIGYSAFLGCTNLAHLTISEGLVAIEDDAFSGCVELTELRLPESLLTLAGHAFEGCASLCEVAIPARIYSIGIHAFSGCSSLKGVYFHGDALPLDWTVFAKVPGFAYFLPGTRGWQATVGGIPTRLWNPRILSTDGRFGTRTNRFGFAIVGSTDLRVVVEASVDPVGSVWLPVGTNVLVDGSSYFGDSDWLNHPHRFYRLRSP